MVEGIVTDDRVPIISVHIGDRKWTAIVDTGFNGGLERPELLRRHVNARRIGRVMSILAANQQVVEDSFLVNFPFDGRNVRIQATFVDVEEISIGTRLLQGYHLQIDFPAKTVVIKKL